MANDSNFFNIEEKPLIAAAATGALAAELSRTIFFPDLAKTEARLQNARNVFDQLNELDVKGFVKLEELKSEHRQILYQNEAITRDMDLADLRAEYAAKDDHPEISKQKELELRQKASARTFIQAIHDSQVMPNKSTSSFDPVSLQAFAYREALQTNPEAAPKQALALFIDNVARELSVDAHSFDSANTLFLRSQIASKSGSILQDLIDNAHLGKGQINWQSHDFLGQDGQFPGSKRSSLYHSAGPRDFILNQFASSPLSTDGLFRTEAADMYHRTRAKLATPIISGLTGASLASLAYLAYSTFK